MHVGHREAGSKLIASSLELYGGDESADCRQTLRSDLGAWGQAFMPASSLPLANVCSHHPPAGWVTLAEVSDFVLSFPWVWNWKCAPGSLSHQPPARLSLFMAMRMNELQSPWREGRRRLAIQSGSSSPLLADPLLPTAKFLGPSRLLKEPVCQAVQLKSLGLSLLFAISANLLNTVTFWILGKL